MIACPLCGGPTDARETRNVGASRVRRRRHCHSVTCPGRVTTMEIPVGDGVKGKRGAMAIVPRSVLEDAQRAIEQAIAVAGDA